MTMMNNELAQITQENIPVPSELKISTMTCLCLLNTDINLDILSRFIRVYHKDDPIITSGKGGIVYVEYFLLLPRGQYCGKKAQIKKKELQINDKLRKIMNNNTNYEGSSFGDSNFKEPDPNKSKKRKKKTIKKRQFENQATLIFHFDKGRYVNIKVFHNGKIQMTGVRSTEEAHLIVLRLIEIIKETTVFKLNWDDVKDDKSWLTKNQYIYTNLNGIDKTFCLVMVNDILTWIDHKDDKNFIVNTPAIPDNTKINMTKFETVMINSNYTIGFNIDRSKLHLILKRKYNIYATLDSTYQAVKSYYFFDSYNQDHNGVCKCDVPCFVIKEQQKGVTPPCSQVTISVFRTGSVIITGGCTLEQTHVAYNFINNVIKDNFKLIYQKNEQEVDHSIPLDLNDPIYLLKQLMIERANENRRRAKKKTDGKIKDTPPKVKGTGKRGRKPKNTNIIKVLSNEIINNPYENINENEKENEPKIKKAKEPKIKKAKEPKIKKTKEPKIKKVKEPKIKK
jgi:TATA-box binding protein (TBP) (component of TFIID and TFIIIB)